MELLQEMAWILRINSQESSSWELLLQDKFSLDKAMGILVEYGFVLNKLNIEIKN
jgi:hypothetical protein